MKRKVTFKETDSLKKLAIMAGKEPDEVSLHIFKSLNHERLQDIELCGESMSYFLNEEGITIEAATLKCFGKSTRLIQMLFNALVFWGTANDCPYCGCEMEIDEKSFDSRSTYSGYDREDEHEILNSESTCSNWTCNTKIHTIKTE